MGKEKGRLKPLSSEAAAKIKIEKDSKPEAMDRLDRRLIQLKIEREAVRKEKDEASVKRFDLIEEEILKLQRELNDLDSIWKAEKAAAQGSEDLLAERDKVRSQIEALTRKGNFDKVAELQYGRLPEIEKRLKAAQDTETGKAKAGRNCCARWSAPKRSPRSSHAPPASRFPS